MFAMIPAIRSVAAVLLVGNVLIVCHELGHYLAARLAGVRVRSFAIGFGPTLARAVDRRGTVWRFSLLPIGGYVSFDGEQDPTTPGSYAGRPALTRMGIIAAGPAANLLVAITVFAIMFATSGEPAFLPVASSVVPGSAADRARFQVGDRIQAMGGQSVATFEDMRPALGRGAGKTVKFKIERGGRIVELFAGLGSTNQGGRTIGVLGIRSTALTHIVLSPDRAIVRASEKTWTAIADSVTGIAQAVTHGRGTDNIAGVVDIAQLTGQAAEHGIPTLLALMAILSANLALMNLLPIPILDGGALVLCLAEMVRGRPLSARMQDLGTRTGFAALATMFMMTTIHDLNGMGLFRWLAQL